MTPRMIRYDFKVFKVKNFKRYLSWHNQMSVPFHGISENLKYMITNSKSFKRFTHGAKCMRDLPSSYIDSFIFAMVLEEKNRRPYIVLFKIPNIDFIFFHFNIRSGYETV